MENEPGNAQLDGPSATDIATLFETLSTDALSVIVKQINSLLRKRMRDKRMSDGARARAHFRYLAQVFSEHSPFRAAAGTMISEIELDWSYAKMFDNLGTKVLTIIPVLFESEQKEMEFSRNVFSACGPYVRRIVVAAAPLERRDTNDYLERFMSHVYQYCRNVNEVKFWGYATPLTKWGTASSFFREYAANLRLIEWHGDEDEAGFPDLRKCVNVRRLKSLDMNTATLVSLLETCGPTIEELDISLAPVGECVEVLDTIRDHCKKLCVLNISNLVDVIDLVGQESYSALICSYGSQLKNATVEGLGHEHLVEVVNSCTNLELTVYWMRRVSADWEHVRYLGPRVASLFFNADLLDGNGYRRALKQCSNLRKLHLLGAFGEERIAFTDAMIANVFAVGRFPKLEDLAVLSFWANERNLGLIASSTATLKSAFFGAFESDLDVSAFEFFALGNMRLDEITVDIDGFPMEDRSAEATLEMLSELLQIFRHCRKLSFALSCTGEGEVQEEELIQVCGVLPCRGVEVHMQIENVSYRYPE